MTTLIKRTVFDLAALAKAAERSGVTVMPEEADMVDVE